jgi:hypothetical protein
MSNAPEEFEKLQKLLKLKRHEQPPPGYFNNFSGRVVSRIEANDRERDPMWNDAPWLRRFLMLLETNPIAAGLFGMSICGLLISGIAYSQYHTPAEYSTDTAGASDMAAATTPAWNKAARVDSTMPSINPVFNTNAPSALFGGLDKLSVQQVNFNP